MFKKSHDAGVLFFRAVGALGVGVAWGTTVPGYALHRSLSSLTPSGLFIKGLVLAVEAALAEGFEHAILHSLALVAADVVNPVVVAGAAGAGLVVASHHCVVINHILSH